MHESAKYSQILNDEYCTYLHFFNTIRTNSQFFKRKIGQAFLQKICHT